MKKLLLAVATVSMLASSMMAEVLTKEHEKIKYTLKAEKALDFQLTFKSPRDKCRVDIQVFDDDNNKLLSVSHSMKKSEDIFHLPVKAGTYYLELTTHFTCFNKPFDFSLTKISGYFEQEYNNKTSQATKMSELNFFYGYLQSVQDEDYFKIDTNATGILKLLFKHKNHGDKASFHLQLMDKDSKEITSVSSSITTEGVTQFVGLEKGTYYIKVFTRSEHAVVGKEYKLAYVLTPNTSTELEPNDDVTQATSIADGKYISGYFHLKESSDKDFYKYNAKAGKYTLVIEHAAYATLSAINITVLDANQKVVKSFSAKGKELRTDFELELKDGLYYINVNTGYTKVEGLAYKIGLIKG